MPDPAVDLLQGTLDLLILRALARESLHGWAIAKRIQATSRDVLTINQGSLYPALYRLVDRGLIAGTPGLSPEGRPLTVYRLTIAGKKQLQDKVQAWQLFAAAVRDVLRYA